MLLPLLRVLLVEDSPTLAMQLVEVLRQLQGVHVIDVVDGQSEAVRILQRESPDVMILDLRLREGTGFGVLRAAQPAALGVKTVVLTNYDLPEYRRQAQALGVSIFLDKSRDVDRLAVLLSALSAEKAFHPNG